METKYYTPDITEFHVGFECEFKNNMQENIWKTETCDWSLLELALDKEEHDKENFPNEFRVKCLDNEDIESLGWEHLGCKWYNLKEIPGELGYWLYVRLRKWGGEVIIHFYRSDPNKYPNCQQEHSHNIIIKNKSELKCLMVQSKLLK